MACKARARPSWKKNTARWRKVVAPKLTRQGQENLAKKQRYDNRHG